MKRLTPAFIIASVWATVSIAATAAERSDKDVSDVGFVWQHAPAVLRDQMVKALPLYDVELIKRQVPRAAEICCEYFCLDASWYGKGKFGASGEGEWDEPDPAKFPQGRADLIELSALVRRHGMGFGLWHDLEIANGAIEQVAEQHPEAVANGRIAFDKPAGRELALKTLRKWINT